MYSECCQQNHWIHESKILFSVQFDKSGSVFSESMNPWILFSVLTSKSIESIESNLRYCFQCNFDKSSQVVISQQKQRHVSWVLPVPSKSIESMNLRYCFQCNLTSQVVIFRDMYPECCQQKHWIHESKILFSVQFDKSGSYFQRHVSWMLPAQVLNPWI